MPFGSDRECSSVWFSTQESSNLTFYVGFHLILSFGIAKEISRTCALNLSGITPYQTEHLINYERSAAKIGIFSPGNRLHAIWHTRLPDSHITVIKWRDELPWKPEANSSSQRPEINHSSVAKEETSFFFSQMIPHFSRLKKKKEEALSHPSMTFFIVASPPYNRALDKASERVDLKKSHRNASPLLVLYWGQKRLVNNGVRLEAT